MKSTLKKIIMLSTPLIISACAGGGGDGAGGDFKNYTCSNFTYQEDAQVAYKNGADQLDRDKDGIACESLPQKPRNPSPQPPQDTTNSASGIWNGTTSDGRKISGVVLDNGKFYFLYADSSNNGIAGVLQGSGKTTVGSFSSSDALDFNFQRGEIYPATVSASFYPQQSFNGSVNYNASSSNSFAATFNPMYLNKVSLETISGSYTGNGISSGGQVGATIFVNANGTLSGTSAGCQFSGLVKNRNVGSPLDLQITFGSSPCVMPLQTSNGTAVFDQTNKQIFAAAINNNRSDGFLFIGNK